MHPANDGLTYFFLFKKKKKKKELNMVVSKLLC